MRRSGRATCVLRVRRDRLHLVARGEERGRYVGRGCPTQAYSSDGSDRFSVEANAMTSSSVMSRSRAATRTW